MDVKAAISLADDVLAQCGDVTFPVDIHLLARALGVSSIESRRMKSDGYLACTPDGALVIRYRQGNSRRRNRFTIAHEIGHILLARAAGREIVENVERNWRRDNAEESAANYIAAELLMPDRVVRRELAARGVCWQATYRMCGVFDVSITAMVRRLLEITDTVAVLFRIDLPCCNTDLIQGYRCETSRHRDIVFFRSPMDEAEDIYRSAMQGEPHCVQLESRGNFYRVQCVSRLMIGHGQARQYWAIGGVVEP